MSYRNGTYTVKVLQSGHAMKTTKEKEEYLRLYLQIQPVIWHGPDGDYDVSEFEAQYINFNLISSNEDSIKYAMSDLESIGFVGTVAQFLSFDWSFTQFKAYCRQNEFKGKVYCNWNVDRPKVEANPLKIEKFDRLMAKFAPKRAPKPTPQPVPTPATTEPQPIQNGEERPDDDIPF